jgi:hypothetical protein
MTNETAAPRSTATTHKPNAPASHLRDEYDRWELLFNAQPTMIQRFLETQAGTLAESVVQRERQSTARFTLPDKVVLEAAAQPVVVPPEFREQMAGGLVDRLTRTDIGSAIRQRLAELEQSPNQALAVSAGLLRHTIVVYLVHRMLPAGRTVSYRSAEGEEIPSIPVGGSLEPASAITASTDAIAENSDAPAEPGRGELLVPYVPAARQFYLPQWVAFDENGMLLVNAISEAEAHIKSMQNFLAYLHAAVSLAPYIVADETYQQKRYGILGQLVNQGRQLVRYQTGEIIRTIKRRAAAQDLNRGLSLSLPYFNDQTLRVEQLNFEVIPQGRIMFIPAFVARAARAEQAKVAQDTRLNHSTRLHLLAEIKQLEHAFETPASKSQVS